MNIAIKGAKAGGKKPRKAVIAPDSAQSKTYIKILYGLSEGEVEGPVNGLQSVYLEDTPLQNSDGSSNFENITADFRAGTNDQDYIEGFPDISSETAVGVELKSDMPWTRAISNTSLDAVRVRLKWGPLRQQNADNGDVSGYTIQYAIELQTDGGTWMEVLNTQISDKTSANYERSHRIDLPKADTGWTLRARRITPNSTSEYVSDKMYVEAITEVIDLKLSYPNTALLGLQYDAETFSNVAKIAVDMKGLKLKVPSNYDPVLRIYTGMWDGTFKRAYTNNPAWIYYDLCTEKRYALGARLTAAMIDKWSLYRLAQYCDQMVPDGKGGLEPRFTCNIYLQSTEDAFSVLTKLAGVFRAISFWDGDSIVCDADIPQDTHFTYTGANVIDGIFEYSGTRARDRHTVAKVALDNPQNHYKTEYSYVRDEAAIARLGVRIAEIAAWGCTSEGQAQRAGQWALKSEQLETRTVSFKVGLDGYIPQPGRVIEVADELFAGRANGGRISAVSANLRTITVDRDDVVCYAGDRLVVNGEDGKAQARIVSSVSGRNITVASAFDSVAAQNIWVVDSQELKTMKFRVMSITQDERHQFSITALQYESLKYDAIDHGAFIDDRPISIINPTIQAPVSSVSVSSETMVQQGLSVETMVISWPQAESAVKYQAEWRKDDGSWIKLPVTGVNSVEVQGIYAGNYQARITAINAFDIASLPAYSALTALTGKRGLPPAPAFIRPAGKLFGFDLEWGFPASGATDAAYTEIQIAATSSGANAAQLGLFAYPTTKHTINGLQPNLTQWFRARLIDRIGNIGPWTSWASATTSADASAVLDILSGKIAESQLHQDLQTKIDKIDAIDGDVADIIQSVINLEDGVTQERSERIAGDDRVLNELTVYKISNDRAVAAAVEDIELIAGDQLAMSSKLEGVFAQVNPPLIGSESDLIGSEADYAGVWSEQSARIEGDLAQSIRTDKISAQMDQNQANVATQIKTLSDAQSSQASRIDTVQSSTESAQETADQAILDAQNKSEAAEAAAKTYADAKAEAEADAARADASNDASAKADAAESAAKAAAALDAKNKADAAQEAAEAKAAAAQKTADNALSGANAANQSIATVQNQVDTLTTAQNATAKQVAITQTAVNDNTASIQDVSESVDGLYAQKFTKLDVNGKVIGWGGANDGVEGKFVFDVDALAIGSGDSAGYYPFTFRTTPYTDPLTGTVFPVSAYLKTAMMDYQSVKTSHIEDLAVKVAKIDNLAVTTAKIDNLAVTGAKIADLAVDTLHIKDRAVTVPLGIQQAVPNAAFTGNVAAGWIKDVSVGFPGIETIGVGNFCTLFFRSDFAFKSTIPDNLAIEVYLGSVLIGSIVSINIPGGLVWGNVRFEQEGGATYMWLPTGVEYSAQVMEQGSIQIAFTMPSGVTASTALKFRFKNNGGRRNVTTSGSYVNLYLVEFKK